MTKTDQNFFKQLVGEVVEEKLDRKLPKLLEEMERRLDKKLEDTFLRYRNDILTKLDAFIKEVRDMRQEQSVHQGNHDDITKRFEELEKIHPQGQHAST